MSDRESLDHGLPAPVDHWHRRGRVALTVLLGASVGLLVDQVTKALAVDAITQSGPIEIAGKLRLTLVANTGVIGGTPMPPWIIVLGALVSLGLGFWWLARSRTTVLFAFAGIVGGGLGNLLDRVQHRPTFPDHAVVDWISIRGFATFNVADLLIVAGVLVLLLLVREDDQAGLPTGY